MADTSEMRRHVARLNETDIDHGEYRLPRPVSPYSVANLGRIMRRRPCQVTFTVDLCPDTMIRVVDKIEDTRAALVAPRDSADARSPPTIYRNTPLDWIGLTIEGVSHASTAMLAFLPVA